MLERVRGRLRSKDDKHPLWSLVLALFLASLYWIYLDKNVTRTVTISCTITKDVSPFADVSTLRANTINLRVPQDYTVSRIIDNDTGKEFAGKVALTFRGPGGVLKHLDPAPILFVNIKEPTSSEYDFFFDRRDIKSAKVELATYLVEMKPSELKIHLVKTSSLDVTLQAERLVVLYPDDPEGEWRKRVFLDTLRFSHATVTLRGSRNLLSSIRPDSKIFELDCRSLPQLMPALLRKAKGNERPTASFTLRLRPKFAALQIVEGEIQASVEVAPPARIFPAGRGEVWTIPVHADWVFSKLTPDRFRVDDSLQILVKSYNPELTRLLESGGETWAKKNIYCYVELEGIPPPEEGTEFYEDLTPHFLCKDQRFLHGRDFEVIVKSIVAVVRRNG